MIESDGRGARSFDIYSRLAAEDHDPPGLGGLRDRFMTPDDALAYGLVDEIVAPRGVA